MISRQDLVIIMELVFSIFSTVQDLRKEIKRRILASMRLKANITTRENKRPPQTKNRVSALLQHNDAKRQRFTQPAHYTAGFFVII